MKIETKILDEFLTETRMGEIQTCLFQFKEEGLYISAMALANSHKAVALLEASAFKEYEAIGNVGVDEFDKLIKVFKRLGKELSFVVEGNLLTAKGEKKELSFELVDEKFIEKSADLPAMDHVTTFKLPSKVLDEFFTDIKDVKDASVFFQTVENGVKIYNTGKYKFAYNEDSEGTAAGETVKLGAPLMSALSGIKTGDLIFHVKSNYPLVVDRKTEHYNITFLIAPLVEKGDKN